MLSPAKSVASCGSNYEVGYRFRLSRISNLEMVDPRFSSWNPMMKWLRHIEAIKANEQPLTAQSSARVSP